MTLTFKVNFGVIHVHVLTKFHDPKLNGCWDMIFFLVIFFLVPFFLVTFVLVNLHRRTDGQTDRQKATHKSPPCMGTGGLKKFFTLKILSIIHEHWDKGH